VPEASVTAGFFAVSRALEASISMKI
jgi:hypothetical protein